MSRKRKRKKKHIPSFTKHYKFNLQDEIFLRHQSLLQDIHSKIARQIFFDLPRNFYGDWTIKVCGINLFIDPVFGCQCEIEGSSKLPLFKRLIIHIWLLKLIKNGYSIVKAVKKCHSMLKIQFKD